MRLPAPFRPLRRRRTSHTERAVRVRKWLAFGAVPFPELAREMRCSRFALRKTLLTMPDVAVQYAARHVATVSLRGAA